MSDERDDLMGELDEDFDVLDTVEFGGELYFVLTPATDAEEIDGEVFVMRRVEDNGEEMLEAVEDDAIFDEVYQIFKEKNKDDFEFLD